MSGYRRFVAYVYEYQKGRKAGNCGFIKVEDRDGRCTMELHLQCPGLTPDVECRIYGFVRRAGLLNGILLGDCRTQAGRIESTVQTDSGDMGGQGVSLREMGGMILQTQNGAFFGTEWDDEPIRPDNFQELTKINEEPSKEEKVMPDTAEEENNSILSGNSIEEPQEPEPRNLEKLEKTKEPEPHIQERDISETDASKIEVLKDTALKDTVPETVIEETADTEKVESTEQRPPEEKPTEAKPPPKKNRKRPARYLTMGRSPAAGRSSPAIWPALTGKTGPFAATGFFFMDITISDISSWGKRQTAPGYWAFPAAMTSRNALWRICSGSRISRKAAPSGSAEDGAATGTVQSIPRISTNGIACRRTSRKCCSSSREKLLYPGFRTSSESL